MNLRGYIVTGSLPQRFSFPKSVAASGGVPATFGLNASTIAYGAVVSAAQAALLERSQIQAAWAAADGHVAALELGFIGCLTGLYLLAAALMRAGSTATTMNLSLLLSDFYSVLVGVGLLGSRPTGWYALAFCCVVGGLLGYHAGSRPKATADGTGSPLAEDLLPARPDEEG